MCEAMFVGQGVSLMRLHGCGMLVVRETFSVFSPFFTHHAGRAFGPSPAFLSNCTDDE